MSPKRQNRRRGGPASGAQPSGNAPLTQSRESITPMPAADARLTFDNALCGKQSAGIWSWPAGMALLLTVLSFLLYLKTTSRSVPAGDSGELIAAAWNLGVAHQPGYPTFTMLSHLAGLLPLGTPAFRLNLLSALLDSLALGVLGFGAVRLLQAGCADQRKDASQLIPIAGMTLGVGLLAVSPVFWSYSLVAEVFALNNLFAALLLFLMLEWARRPTRSRFLWFSGLFAGLAVTNQMTIVLLAPGLVVLLVGGLLRRRREVGSASPERTHKNPPIGPSWRLRDIGIAAGFFVVGLLPYIYLPLAARADPPINFGDPRTLTSFWRVVTRASYGSFSLISEGLPGDRFQQLVFLGRYLVRSFTPVGVVLAMLGIVWFARRRRAEGIGIGLAFLFSGPVFAMFANPQLQWPLTQGVFERFYILPSIPFALFLAAGAALVLEGVQRLATRVPAALVRRVVVMIGLAAALAMPGVIAITRLPTVDLSDNHVAEDYGRDLLAPLEPDALLIMAGDYNYDSVVYMQHVLGFRTDVVAVPAELLYGPYYIAQQLRFHPGLIIPFAYYGEGHSSSLVDLVSANLAHRPVYVAGIFKEDLSKSYDEVYWGLATRLVKKGEGTDSSILMRPESDRFASLHFPPRRYPPTSWESVMAEQYGILAFRLASDRQLDAAQPDHAFIERLYRSAILNAPNVRGSYKNLGNLLLKNGGSPSETIALFREYLELVPDDPDAGAIRTAIATLHGDSP